MSIRPVWFLPTNSIRAHAGWDDASRRPGETANLRISKTVCGLRMQVAKSVEAPVKEDVDLYCVYCYWAITKGLVK
jgi:hypothetical protein